MATQPFNFMAANPQAQQQLGAFMESLSPSMFQSNGFNPQQYATNDAASSLAKILGGNVVQTQQDSMFGIPQQNLISLPGGGDPINAGLAMARMQTGVSPEFMMKALQDEQTAAFNVRQQLGMPTMQDNQNPSLVGYSPDAAMNAYKGYAPPANATFQTLNAPVPSATGGRPPGTGSTQQGQNQWSTLPGGTGGTTVVPGGTSPGGTTPNYPGGTGYPGTTGGYTPSPFPGTTAPGAVSSPYGNWTPSWTTPAGTPEYPAANGAGAGSQFLADATNDLGYLRGIAANAGYATDATPAWQSMIAAMQRNQDRQQADLAEQFNVSGNRFGRSFGNAMTDFQNQALLNQNSLLGQMTLQSQEAARAREASAAGQLGGLAGQAGSQLSQQEYGAGSQGLQAALQAALAASGGSDQSANLLAQLGAQGAMALFGGSNAAAGQMYGTENNAALQMYNAQNGLLPAFMQYDAQLRGLGNNAAQNLSQLWQQNLGVGNQLGMTQYGVDTQNLDRMYQEWLRTQPEYNPIMPYLFSSATAQPTMYAPSYQPSTFSQVAGGLGSLMGGIGSLAGIFSDETLKEGITDSKRGLETLKKIRIVDFIFKADPRKQKHQGVIAQELMEVVPEAVMHGGLLRVNYETLVPLLVKSVQQLTAKVARLEAEVA